MATYRFLRWDVTHRKDVASAMQVGEFEVRSGGVTVSWPVGTSASATYFGCPTAEPPANLIDGTTAKYLDFGFRHASSVVFTFPSMTDALSFDGYRFQTADNRPESDPVSWFLEGSFDGASYSIIDEVVLSSAVPSARTTYTPEFELAEAVRFRHIRWRMTHVRQLGASGLSAFVDRITATEFQLMSGGTPLAWPGSMTVTNADGTNPSGEGPDKLIDGSSITRWADTAAQTNGNARTDGHSRMEIDCGVGNSVTFDAYRYRTASDTEGRDPTIWKLYGSNNGTDWDLLDTRFETITPSRDTFTSDFQVGRVEATTGEAKLLTGTQGLRYPARPGNLLSDPGFETGIADWTAQSGLYLAQWKNLVTFRTGKAAMAMFNSGTPTAIAATSPLIPVTPGKVYEITAWGWRQSLHGLLGAARLGITWRSNGAFAGSVSGAQRKLSSTFGLMRVTGVAPTNATHLELTISHVFPVAGDFIVIDDVHIGVSAETTTFTAGSPTDGSLTALGPSAEGAFAGDNVVDGAFAALGPSAEAAFAAELEGAALVAVGPAAVASFTGDTIAPSEAELVAVGPSPTASLTGDPAHPDNHIQPVDIRVRRPYLRTRALPAQWRER